MSFDGNGNWVSDFSAVSDRNADIKILASRFDGILLEDLARSFSNCLTRDGQGRMLTNFNVNNYRVLNMAEPVDTKDATTKGYVDSELARRTECVGKIVMYLCTPDYVPEGCLACDGQEYGKDQFLDLWNNYLTGEDVKLVTCSYADYASDISLNGFCDKIAIDTVNETFKVPTLNNKVYQGGENTFAVKGNGMTMGFTNGSDTYGIRCGGSGYQVSQTGLYGVAVGTNSSGSNITASKGGGLTTDPTKSGIVAENNTKEATSLRYFIVVSNGTINQAQMDWSAWASSLDGKMDKNASNATNTAKETVVGWGIPDYTAGISFSSGSTTPAYGVLKVRNHQRSSPTVMIDGVNVYDHYWTGGDSGDEYLVCYIQVAKNKTITYTKLLDAKFYPYLGG